MRNKGSRVDESSSRWIVSGSATDGVSAGRLSQFSTLSDEKGRGMENSERNQPDVVFSVNECIRKRTKSRETRTTSASEESNAGCVLGSALEVDVIGVNSSARRSSVTDAMRHR